jgi:hypothetical protein
MELHYNLNKCPPTYTEAKEFLTRAILYFAAAHDGRTIARNIEIARQNFIDLANKIANPTNPLTHEDKIKLLNNLYERASSAKALHADIRTHAQTEMKNLGFAMAQTEITAFRDPDWGNASARSHLLYIVEEFYRAQHNKPISLGPIFLQGYVETIREHFNAKPAVALAFAAAIHSEGVGRRLPFSKLCEEFAANTAAQKPALEQTGEYIEIMKAGIDAAEAANNRSLSRKMRAAGLENFLKRISASPKTEWDERGKIAAMPAELNDLMPKAVSTFGKLLEGWRPLSWYLRKDYGLI